MKKIIAFAAFALLFVGCTVPPTTVPESQPQIQPEPPPPQPVAKPQPPAPVKPQTYDGPPWHKYDLNEGELEVTTDFIKRKLKDPAAAVHDMKRYSRGMKDDYICGKLDAINTEDGAKAFKRFYINNKNAIIFEDDRIIGYLVRRLCLSSDAPAASTQSRKNENPERLLIISPVRGNTAQ